MKICIVEPLPGTEPLERRQDWVGVDIERASLEELSSLSEDESYLHPLDGLLVLKSQALKGMKATGRGTTAKY